MGLYFCHFTNRQKHRSFIMSVIGYIRVSCNKQTCQHQKYEIEQFARNNKCKIDRWVQETISSRQPLNKRKLGKLLNEMTPSDILVACEISRLGRSMLEVMRILETCLNKDCQVWTIKENYRLGNDIQSKVMAFAFGLSAEIERNLISQRTKASLDNLRARGKKIGRPFGPHLQRLLRPSNTRKITQMLRDNMPKVKIAKKMRVNLVHLNRLMRHLPPI